MMLDPPREIGLKKHEKEMAIEDSAGSNKLGVVQEDGHPHQRIGWFPTPNLSVFGGDNASTE